MVYVIVDGKYMFNGDLVDVVKWYSFNDDVWVGFCKVELVCVLVV